MASKDDLNPLDPLDQVALDFARICLRQPESYLDQENFRRVAVRPDGFNYGPESFADGDDLDYESIDLLTQLVTYWCELNALELNVLISRGSYQCRIILGDPPEQIFESAGSRDLPFELLSVCVEAAKHMKSINIPSPSMSRAEFINNRPKP